MICVSLILGVILFVFCTLSDLRDYGWWKDQSYIPNIVASITSFLIGAPIGLVVLATFTKEREDNATLERVNRLSQHAWYSFRDLILEYCSDTRSTALQEQARYVVDLHRKSVMLYHQFDAIVANAGNIDVYFEQILAASVTALETSHENFRLAVHELQSTVDYHNRLENEWASTQGAWQTLDQYVRLQRLEQQLQWFSAEADGGIRRWMMRASDPIQEFMEVHGYPLGPMSMLGKSSSRTMFSAVDTLYDDASSGDIHSYSCPVPLYEMRRAAAYNFILDLQRYITQVEMELWPESESEPKDSAAVVFEPTPSRALASLFTKEGEAEWYRVAAQVYHKKLRRRPKGNMSGPESRAFAKEREKSNAESKPIN